MNILTDGSIFDKKTDSDLAYWLIEDVKRLEHQPGTNNMQAAIRQAAHRLDPMSTPWLEPDRVPDRESLSNFLFTLFDLGTLPNALRKADAILAHLRGDTVTESPNHSFQPVERHPDDDECTFRADGTDLSYCGESEEAHNDVEAGRG